MILALISLVNIKKEVVCIDFGGRQQVLAISAKLDRVLAPSLFPYLSLLPPKTLPLAFQI